MFGYIFILQLNCRRLKERRTPEVIDSLQTPYNPERFNFTWVKSEEILFLLRPKQYDGIASNGCLENDSVKGKEVDKNFQDEANDVCICVEDFLITLKCLLKLFCKFNKHALTGFIRNICLLLRFHVTNFSLQGL